VWVGVSTVNLEIRLSMDRTSDWISRAASIFHASYRHFVFVLWSSLWLRKILSFEIVRVKRRDGGRGGRGKENLHSTPHCSLHHLEYRNVDGCTLKQRGAEVIFRIACESDIFLNMCLYQAKNSTFMTFGSRIWRSVFDGRREKRL
jgi:hypothetical protein